MSDFNAKFNSTNLTLQDFKNIAEQSKADAEVRIKKSDGKLSTTPLGFISRNIGLGHKNSNNQATLAFWTVLIHDDKYKDISNNLRRTMRAMQANGTIKAGSALTPAKITQAIKTADDLLQAHNKAKTTAENFILNAEKNHVVDPKQTNALKNFAEKIAFAQLIKKDFTEVDRDGNEISYSLDDNKAFFKSVLKAFYENRNPDYFASSELLKVDSDLFDGDKNKTDSIDKFVKNLFPDYKNEEYRKAFISAIDNSGDFVIDDNNKQPDGKFGSKTLLNTFSLGSDDCIAVLKRLSSSQLDKIGSALKTLQIPDKAKADSFSKLLYMLKNAISKNKQFNLNTVEGQDKFNTFLDKLSEFMKTQQTANPVKVMNFIRDYMIENFKGGLSSNAELTGFCSENGISLNAFKALLLQQDYKAELSKNYAQSLDFNATIAGKLKEYASANLETLRKLSGIDVQDSLISTTYSVGNYTDAILQELSSDNPDGTKILDQMKLILTKLKSPEIKNDSDSSEVLNTAVKTLLNSLSEDVKQKVLSPNGQKILLSLGAEMNNICQKDASLNADLKGELSSLAEVTLSFCKVMTAGLSEDKRVDPASIKVGQVNNEVKNNALHEGKIIPRQASDTEIFIAHQSVMKNPQYDMTQKDRILKVMKATRCTDIAFVTTIMHASGSAFIESHIKTFKSNSSQDKPSMVTDLSNLAKFMQNATMAAEGYNKDEVISFVFDAIIGICTPEQRKNIFECLQSSSAKMMFEIFNTLDKKEKENRKLTYATPSLEARKNENDGINLLLNNINKLSDKLAADLKIQNPGPVYNPDVVRHAYDLNYQNLLDGYIGQAFPYAFRAFDQAQLGTKIDLPDEKREAVRNFIFKLKVPVENLREYVESKNPQKKKNDITNLGAYDDVQAFVYKHTNEDGEIEDAVWTPKEFMCLAGSKVKEISDLLDKTDGNPTAQQLWTVLHGGQAPEGLTMDNLIEKLTLTLHDEIRAIGQLLGREDFIPDYVLPLIIDQGYSIDGFISKFSKADKEDIVFDLKDQKGTKGFFPVEATGGLAYQDGSQIFAFGLDFERGINPQGVTSDDLIKISLETTSGEKKVFSQKECQNSGNKDLSSRQLYMKDMAEQIKVGLGNIPNKQLGSVGWCTCQAQLDLLKLVPLYYNRVSCGNEHTALDYSIKKLDNGNVQVNIKEKPGTAFFSFNMVLEVSPNGEVNCKDGRITFASQEKILNYKKEHPDTVI